jgi:GST-like protein
MIHLYTWATPNGRKISIALEELALPYQTHPVDISADEQFRPEFLEISPNNKIPAIVEEETGITMMESGAILQHLAAKTGKLGGDEQSRWNVTQWLMWQKGGLGPMLGQAYHFLQVHPEVEYAAERYRKEAQRLYGVLDKQFANHEFLAGSEYSIADIATWPWTCGHKMQGVSIADFPHVKRWYEHIAARPAVQRGYRVPDAEAVIPAAD